MKKIIFISILIISFFSLVFFQQDSFMGASLFNQEDKILITEQEYEKYSSLLEKTESLKKEINGLNNNLKEQRNDFSEMISLIEEELKQLIVLASQRTLEGCREDQININRASKEELKQIIYIGEVLSEEIIENRPFSSLRDLLSVSGIGESSFNSIIEQGLACVEEKETFEEEKKVEETSSDPKEKLEEKDSSSEDSSLDPKEKSSDLEECKKDSIDVNKASKEELELLTGIGSVYAENIIKKRPFSSLDDLTEAKGIGEITLENIKEQGCAFIEEEDLEKETSPTTIQGGSSSSEESSSKEASSDLEECKEDSIDINEASKEELELLTGIGPVYAENIIKERPFSSLKDLLSVSGIGEKTLENIKEQGCAFVEEEDSEEDEESSSSLENEEGNSSDSEECEEKSIDINKANKEELKLLDGIASTLAKRIIENRPFSSLTDLKEVNRIGKGTLENIKEQGCAFVEKESSSSEEDKEKSSDSENDEYFELNIDSLDFRIDYGDISESQKVKVSSSKDDLDLETESSSWVDVASLEEDNFEVLLETSKKEVGNYEEEIIFKYKDQTEKISIYLEIIGKEENLLKNEFFDIFTDEDFDYWDSDHGRVSSSKKSFIGDYSMNINHSYGYSNGRDDDQSFFHSEGNKKETTYFGEIWVKGKGDVRIGIKRPGYSWTGSYGDWVTIDSEEWVKVRHEITKDDREGKEGMFRIRHRQSEDKDITDLYIGAAWLGTREPPEDWF